MRVNQLGCFLGMKAVVDLMERSGGGSIVNISSVAGLRGSPNAIAYSATKWALRGMTKAATIELAPRRIRVNSVHAGPIDTEMLNVPTRDDNLRRVQQDRGGSRQARPVPAIRRERPHHRRRSYDRWRRIPIVRRRQ
jgi:3alpha(or 20beta)-hydroxysteroid dehydrogenase